MEINIKPKAVAFTHLPLANYGELENSLNIGSLDSWIDQEWGNSILAFDNCKNIKLVYLFYSQAYQSFISNHMKSEEYAASEIMIASSLNSYIHAKCAQPSKFQFVGLQQLRPLLNELASVAKNRSFSLNKLLLGSGSNLFYDCPKIPEAFIRVARRHRHEAILRFDADVFVDEKSVSLLIDKWMEQLAEGKKYFFFSGSYFYHDIKKDKEQFYLNDYSVRTHFISSGPRGESYEACDETELEFHINSDLASHFINRLVQIGTAPAGQPISGAGLCISPLAITQFPPFANMSKNIVWIDDSIKRFLHEGVNDLSLEDVSIVDGAKFRQDRYPKGIHNKDIMWAKNNYISRLILGCIIHSLIHPPAIAEGAYSKSIQKYMSSGVKPGKQEIMEWIEIAKNRVEKIRHEWSDSIYNDKSGKMLKDAASTLLVLKESSQKMLEEFLASSLTVNISDLSNTYRFSNDEHAAAYIANAIQDVLHYFDLLDIWPYVIRTIDFMTRYETRDYNWLTR